MAILARLGNLWRRLRVRPLTGTSVELKPAEQAVLRFLLRSGSADFATIDHQIGAFRGSLPRPPAYDVLAKLIADGLIEARTGEAAKSSETSYAPTRKGERLGGRIPEAPRTVTQFWL